MAKDLVIVESPAKARTLTRILGGRYLVKASLGHVRDLPKSALGVDVGNGFAPKYLVPKEKREVVSRLSKAAKGASSVYLATDPDREGEAISWHLVEATRLDKATVKRVVFHEITREAITEAFRHPRAIDMCLVNAQQARRILDRLVGYKLSPLLWQKVKGGLSAGRVQSVALRMIVDRELEIEGFVPKEYWTIEAELAKSTGESFTAALVGFSDTSSKLEIPNRDEAVRITAELEEASYIVANLNKKETARQPPPPFITSTLQQEAWRKLRFTAKHTMAVAQQLYEGLPIGREGSVGLITYMRTDSKRVSPKALTETRHHIQEKYGSEYLPPHPRQFTKKVKGAQEAHEAIRPTSVRREPSLLKPYLSRDQFRLYELIWKRMVASQMAAALIDSTTAEIEAKNPKSGRGYLLRATSSVIKFPGFMTLYQEGKDDGEASDEGKATLPGLAKGELLELLGLRPERHFTQPPPRYTEATLIKALEENGIGRPSTYALILSTIQERGYVEKQDGQFHPLKLGLIVDELLREHFPEVIDVGFTAQMEKELDEIARGEREWVPVIEDFYTPFEKTIKEAASRIKKVEALYEPAGETCPMCGKPMVIKSGRFGKFLACSGYPHCKTAKPFLIKVGVTCPQCGGELVERQGRKRRTFYGCANYPDCNFTTRNRPVPEPCPRCGGLLTLYRRKWAKCIKCEYKGGLEELKAETAVI